MMKMTLRTLVISSIFGFLATTTLAADVHEAAANSLGSTLQKEDAHGAVTQDEEGHDHEEKSAEAVQGDEHDEHEEHGTANEDQHGVDSEESEQHAHGEEQQSIDAAVTLSPVQMRLANIQVADLRLEKIDFKLYAPGEIVSNGYSSYFLSPRVDSVVIKRHVALGDHVTQGQALVTLFSETVADAQADYRIAYSEWQRVKGLGQKTVGDKRYVASEAEYDAAYARLLAYGLSETAIDSVSKKSGKLGEYTLESVIDGAVMTDDFHQGQRVSAGTALMALADEQQVWVEARLAANNQVLIPKGSEAKIKVGNEFFTAAVTQTAHTIDRQTRTRVVRLLIENTRHQLHPGQFADVYFQFQSQTPVLAVPESALMRSADGDWTVFVEQETGQFVAQEVELGRSFNQLREIKGIQDGSRIVMQGAFFVASEIAKGGFDPHNH